MPRPLARTGPRVVVVGAGFGGLAATRALARAPVSITLVDRRNYHLFQPLLYQVATAALSPADIAWPIRAILSRQANVAVQLGRVVGIDRARREVVLEGRRLPFDLLVLATGARHSYFGMDEWEATAPGLKKIADATSIRERILLAFERAEITSDPEERRCLLTFVVIGGGPTGVEMAGAVAELAGHALAADFRAIDPMAARVILVEGGARLLGAFPPELSEKARRQLARLRVEVRLGQPVQRCDAEGVTIGEERIAARTVVWAAGVIASPAARWLDVPHDRAGRVLVGADLGVPGWDEVFAIGDTAAVNGADGRPVPGIAPAAKQMGVYVARAIDANVRGRALPPPFRYVHHGSLATIGRKAAVADLGGVQLSGFPAWALWAVAHVWFLIGWRNRMVVALNWLWSYVTFQRGARLITSGEEQMAAMGSDLDQAKPAATLFGGLIMRRPAAIEPSPVLLDERAFQALIRWAEAHGGTLSEQLASLAARIRGRLEEPQRKALAAALERLRMLQIVEQGLALGELLPEFALPDADGRVWTGTELLDRGPLALAFVRGAWCPYCSLCLVALDKMAPLIAQAGGSLAVVLPAEPAELARIRADRGLTLTLLADPDAAFARVCGVQYQMSDGQASLYRSFGLDLAASSDWGVPVPASYVAGQDGRIVYAFADLDWSRRAEPGDILAAVERLLRPPSPAPASA